MTLGDHFDRRANGLNALRLALAVTVLVWHSYPLTGRDVESEPLRALLEFSPVDGFFAISGFLIAESWVRRPDLRMFLMARVLRIFPGFLVCLVVTAVALAPIGILLSGASFPANYVRAAVTYVVANATLNMTQFDIAGTPTAVSRPGAWNGSLWTLRWEFVCYVGVIVLGLTRLLTKTTALLIVWATFATANVLSSTMSSPNYWIDTSARFGTVFMAGVVIHHLRGKLPYGSVAVGLAAAGFLLSLTVPAHQAVGSLFLAYLMIAAGGGLRSARFRLRNDISYGVYIYAFPVQQILAGTAAGSQPVGMFMLMSLALTLPLAAASWFAVERPANRLKHAARATAPVMAPSAREEPRGQS